MIIKAKSLAETETGKPNRIRATTIDPHTVEIQILLSDDKGSWIEFNAEQLDVVIAMLQKHRSEIT